MTPVFFRFGRWAESSSYDPQFVVHASPVRLGFTCISFDFLFFYLSCAPYDGGVAPFPCFLVGMPPSLQTRIKYSQSLSPPGFFNSSRDFGGRVTDL